MPVTKEEVKKSYSDMLEMYRDVNYRKYIERLLNPPAYLLDDGTYYVPGISEALELNTPTKEDT